MGKLIFYASVQSLFLVISQIFLKLAVARSGNMSFTWSYIKEIVTTWQMICSGLSIMIATIIWMYIFKHYEFSQAYPLISISYVFAIIAAVVIFHEAVPFTRWLGIALIIVGVIFVTK
ncbi:MAG TPA: EamA family transporter [Bacteroidales bacterium]|nr:EamA family transporter [Bacteroidales bacterium]